MTALLYSHTEDAYDAGYDELKQYCKMMKKSAFFAYFEKNRDSCRAKWSNFARGSHFTTGNTTTNRTESNWTYLKMLLGLKARIDKNDCWVTSALIYNYTANSSWNWKATFYDPIYRLSSDVLKIMKQEWIKFVNRAETTSCERSLDLSIWKVYSMNQSFTCHDVDWSCNCLFYTSKHLPCRHLLHVADKEHGFQVLPSMSICES
ncbi:Hypothetical protein PHPALM_17573 [Phytophthora palmivora]|uniref:SWIM-type domain-containing protein n=1 Tax=Phytophthora palmivora TaxID=4796 RepID=A0A2P4XLY0_9STRA|nr:Hypothetical protein PHPALM_17573 [Phytophthora palmivora]